MGAVNVFPEVVLRKETGVSMLDFRTVLLAVNHQEAPCYIFLIILQNYSLSPMPGKEFERIYIIKRY